MAKTAGLTVNRSRVCSLFFSEEKQHSVEDMLGRMCCPSTMLKRRVYLCCRRVYVGIEWFRDDATEIMNVFSEPMIQWIQ